MTLNQLIGIGLRHPHYASILEEKPSIGWLEVHSENFFHQGGPTLNILTKIREYYPISIHGIALSLGSADGIDLDHLKRLQILINHIDPFLISEHLSWNRVAGVSIPDLLPIPYNKESLTICSNNVSYVQDFLKRELLIENPSSYLEYKESHQAEADFLVELCYITGARILLDINNIFVSCFNHGWNAKQYIDSIPIDFVKEIHLAGHSHKNLPDNKLLKIDTHDDIVCTEVWDLYAYALSRFGATPTLLEWDAKIPELDLLIKEANKSLPYLNIYEKPYACTE